MIPGAKYRGDSRIASKAVVREVVESDGEVILFIDEMHTIVGSGPGRRGQLTRATCSAGIGSRRTAMHRREPRWTQYRKHMRKTPLWNGGFSPCM